MTILSCLAANWQKALPYLSALGLAAWIALFRNHPLSERAIGRWIGYYNADRPHSVFGGRTPDEVYATQATEEKLAA